MTTEPAKRTLIVQAPLFAPYADVGHAIRLFDGEPVKRVRETMKAIYEQAGTPQSAVDWSDPDTWINERLSGELRALARKVWDGSGKTLNPRYLYGCYLFINKLNLLDQDDGIYRLGERGRRFLDNDEAILRELDAMEGIPKLLSLVAERSPCKRGDILPAWSDYLKAVSLFTTPKTFADTLALGFESGQRMSAGTAKTLVEALGQSGRCPFRGATSPRPITPRAFPTSPSSPQSLRRV
jgi:restriction system protein